MKTQTGNTPQKAIRLFLSIDTHIVKRLFKPIAKVPFVRLTQASFLMSMQRFPQQHILLTSVFFKVNL